ncbi:hypothetical protein ACI3RH_14885, partial [Lactococcus lactis]
AWWGTLLSNKSAVKTVLRFIENTEVGKKRLEHDANRNDSWDIDRLDRDEDEVARGEDGG